METIRVTTLAEAVELLRSSPSTAPGMRVVR
jgi:hypothetical protein